MTERLLIEGHNASPIFLNMIVASLLLQQENDVYFLKELVNNCQKLYAYLQARSIKTTMTQSPNRKTVIKVIEGLGYKLRPIKSNITSASKSVEYEIFLEKKQNQRELLSLSYYSINILQHIAMESFLGKILYAHSKSKNEEKLTFAMLEEQVG